MNDFPFLSDTGTINQFIACWSKFYNYGGIDDYFMHITNNPLTEENIRELFKWKNGMRLSDKKDISLETKIMSKLNIINALRSREEITFQCINENFRGISAIWRIFVAHIIRPEQFPIFDQHVYRAMKYLQTRTVEELKNNDKLKLQIYEHEYLKFYNSFASEADHYKIFDEAMWAFGKFLIQNRPRFE